MDTWVGIEVTRQLRVNDGQLQPAGALSVGGVNLLDHQLMIARQITDSDHICVLSPQGDETMLELIARHEVRELAPFDFIAMLNDRAKQGEAGAVVLLRQIAPLHDARPVKSALKLLKNHPAVVSASRPPEGHKRHEPLPGETAPDYRCLAFEVRRLDQFGLGAMDAANHGNEELLFIAWDDFAEYTRPEDKLEVTAKIANWRI
ncbi:MAG: hypothetical protein K8I27_05630 [Planctomycetes bacterium]|nr:hypothetical protein [Planctomycetota bacterium]